MTLLTAFLRKEIKVTVEADYSDIFTILANEEQGK
jgi:hypothetical protein